MNWHCIDQSDSEFCLSRESMWGEKKFSNLKKDRLRHGNYWITLPSGLIKDMLVESEKSS